MTSLQTAHKKRVTLQVREGDRLLIPSELNPAKTRDKLMQATNNLPFDTFFYDKKGMRAGRAVGVVDIGYLQVEILPRVSSTSAITDDKRYLIDLLSTSGLMPRSFSSTGNVSLDKLDLLESIIKAFAADLAGRLISGPPRRYSECNELSPVLRGRVDFSRMARRLPGTDHILPIRYSPLQFDNSLSRLVLATVNTLLSVTHSATNRSTLLYISSMLDRVTSLPLTEKLVESVNLSRFESDWHNTVQFAAALIKGYSPIPVSAGPTGSFTLLFSLNDLFEIVLRKSLVRSLHNEALKLSQGHRNLNLLRSTDTGRETLKLKPDYLFSAADDPDKKILVGDAKWKRLLQNPPLFDLKREDVYQLTTYMYRHSLIKGIFFFPLNDWMLSDPGFKNGYWSHQFALVDNPGTINLAAINITDLVSKDHNRQNSAITSLKLLVLASS